MKTRLLGVSLPLLLAFVLGGGPAVAQEPPGVRRLGATQVRYQGTEIDLVASHRFAASHLGADWLFLDVAFTGTRSEAVEVNRDAIRLRLPDGSEVPLPTQQEFGTAYRDIHAMVARANLMADPLDIWAGRTPQPLNFLVAPGEGVALLSVWANDRRVYTGRLYFLVPGGVQPGPYELRVTVRETTAHIPFTLEDGQR